MPIKRSSKKCMSLILVVNLLGIYRSYDIPLNTD